MIGWCLPVVLVLLGACFSVLCYGVGWDIYMQSGLPPAGLGFAVSASQAIAGLGFAIGLPAAGSPMYYGSTIFVGVTITL